MAHHSHSDAATESRADGTNVPSGEATPDGPTVLELAALEKTYASETAVRSLSLSVRQGEIVALLGPSGCGKTTTLRMISGLERPDAGRITLDGERIVAEGSDTVRPPEERGIGLVFQDFALFPHLTAAENVGFGLADREPAAREARVESLLELVDLVDHGEDYPGELSGGQKQRIALARSLAPEPDVLLLDEPLSNLDVGLRVSMREEIVSIIEETGVTAVWVTHDQEEALSVADRVGVMNDGRLEQVDTPERIFARPTSRFVASFLGQAGFLSARVDGDHLATDVGPIALDRFEGVDESTEGEGDVLVRPDDLRATPTERDDEADGRITRRQYHGPTFVYRVETDGGDVVHCQQNHTEVFGVGDRVRVDLVADHPLQWFDRE